MVRAELHRNPYVYRPGRVVRLGYVANPDAAEAEYPGRLGGGRVTLKRTDVDGAEEALTLALVIYGEFLERSESGIGHGVTPLARRLLAQHLNAKAAETAS